MQRSDSFILGSLLSFSGGLQDAYTFNVRDHVFANAQTGNVVLMSQNFLTGQWGEGMDHLFPVISFVAGVFLSEYFELRIKNSKRIHWRQVILLVEFLLLLAVGFMPLEYERLANSSVSFACAMQVHAFRTLRGNKYATTMCIGNLKSGTTCLTRFVRSGSTNHLINAIMYYAIIAVFGLGAGIGGILSGYMGIHTIWVSCGILLFSVLFMMKETI